MPTRLAHICIALLITSFVFIACNRNGPSSGGLSQCGSQPRLLPDTAAEYQPNARQYDAVCLPEAWYFMQNQWRALNPNTPKFPTLVVIDDGFFPTDDSGISPNIYPGYPNGSGHHPEGSSWGDSTQGIKEFGYHGTSVLSLMSSITNNGTHFAGVAGPWAGKPGGQNWGPYFMPVRIGYGFPISPSPYWAIKAFDGAVLNRAGTRIVNISLDIVLLKNDPELETRIRQADYNHQIVVVTGSGNHRETVPADAWIRRFENVIVVGALNPTGTDFWKKDETNGTATGPGVDLYAPGEDLTILIGDRFIQQPVRQDSGTSFSAPMVSGIVAMILNVDPSLDSWLVRDILVKTADQITPLSGGAPIPRLNAIRAVSCAKALRTSLSIGPDGGMEYWSCNMGALGWAQGDRRSDLRIVPPVR